MLEVQSYSTEALKNELKEARILKTVSATFIDKKYINHYSASVKAHEINNRLKKLYSVKSLPVKVGDIIIDYKLYQSFLKKLRGFQSKLTLSDSALFFEYWKFGSKNKGRLVLEDLSSYYDGFKHIPTAVLVDGS